MTETWSQRIDRYIAEGRTVSGGKGSDSAASVRDQEMAMQKQAFNKQQAMIDQLTKAFSGDLSGKNGFDPATLAAMKAAFLNSNDSTFNQAGSMVREALGARGNTGGNPTGGDFTRGISGLLGMRAGSQSQGILGVDIQNAQQAIANKFNAGSILSGNAATLTGPQGVAGSAMSNALNDFMKAENSGFGASFMSSFGSSLGKVGADFIQGGLGKATGGWGAGNSNQGNNSGGCWIAAACFDGWDDPRTIAVRSYLNGEFKSHWYGRIVMKMYMAIGERVSKIPVVVSLLRPLFNLALRKAG